jgi:site-specific recombinase XerD
MPTKTAAEDWVKAIEIRVRNGQVGIVEKTDEERARANVTLAQLVEKFNAEYRPPKVKNIAEYRVQTKAGMAARVLPALGSRRATSITSNDVETLRDRLLDEGYAGGSVAWTLARLSKVYAWGIKKNVIDGINPVSGVDYPEAASSIDYLSRAEVTALLSHLDDPAPISPAARCRSSARWWRPASTPGFAKVS